MKVGAQALLGWYRRVIRNPKYRWWLVIGTLVYLVSPFDISPDMIPLIGEIDDVAIVSLLVAEVSQLALEKYKSKKNGEKATVPAGETESTTIEVPVKASNADEKTV